MVDTSKCETKQDLKEAMQYENLRFELQNVKDDIWASQSKIKTLETIVARLEERKTRLEQELEKYRDKDYIVQTSDL